MFGKPRSEETKKKISESRKGKYCGENSKNFGKPRSEETKKKISDANTNGKTSKPVLQFTLDGEFVREWPSTMECERNGFYNTNVSACCRGKLKSYKGFVWKYKD